MLKVGVKKSEKIGLFSVSMFHVSPCYGISWSFFVCVNIRFSFMLNDFCDSISINFATYFCKPIGHRNDIFIKKKKTIFDIIAKTTATTRMFQKFFSQYFFESVNTCRQSTSITATIFFKLFFQTSST